ncbi:hypothetical protein JTE90_010834 [Oedothorax gibbosus]|uniref:EGF-like domain-containing protein n=1 Tax=Oedothorax gibbosus TaxID=931172 RepID=A0AAV6V4W4_9ARAC|nr:hypothetical protein JTE90_010834 [Oedothorax gibbosus]
MAMAELQVALLVALLVVVVDGCPAPWSNASTTHTLSLDEHQVFCQYPKKCFSPNVTEEDAVIPLELKEGDWIVLELSMGNESLEVSVEAGEEAACGTPFTPRWKGTNNVTLKEDLLPAGVHLLTVRAGSPSCAVSWSLNVTVRADECQRDHQVCSGKGNCRADHSKASRLTCQCCPGYVGRFCEERDACFARPCQHGGFCVDITEGLTGSTFQCLCPHGFRGEACEEEVSACERNPCLHNGTCRGNQSAYWCDCPPGYSGRHCDASLNLCLSSPCVHGVCEDALGTYKCYCLPGYGGEHCEFEYDECDSSPCINGGACEDLVAGYRCHCGPGYAGRRCYTKLDLCAPNPCPPPAHCVDRGNNYSCICHPGYNGPGCTQQYDPCFPNPCQNGGSCWPSLDSFFCSCRPGYTGDTCEELRYPGLALAHTLEDTSVYRSSATIGPAAPQRPHWQSASIAAATLAGTCLMVVAVVTVCHCKVHKTYRRFTRKLSRYSSTDLKQDQLPRQVFTEVVWERF